MNERQGLFSKVFGSRGLNGISEMRTFFRTNEQPIFFISPTAFNLLKTASGGGVTVGPILLGAARPVHILTPSATVRRLVNMTALAVADANAPRAQGQSLF